VASLEWKEHLLDIFAATVNQQPLEEAAMDMASLSFLSWPSRRLFENFLFFYKGFASW